MIIKVNLKESNQYKIHTMIISKLIYIKYIININMNYLVVIKFL